MSLDTSLTVRALAPVGPQARRPETTEAAQPGLGFDDVVDAVNPLHHIPGVSLLYGAATGDRIGALSRLAGGFLFGGPLGLLGGAATIAFEAATGDGVAGHAAKIADAVSGPGTPPAAGAMPWMKADAAPASPALPDRAVMAEALARKATPDAAPVIDAPAVAADPTTLAALYSLKATREGGQA